MRWSRGNVLVQAFSPLILAVAGGVVGESVYWMATHQFGFDAVKMRWTYQLGWQVPFPELREIPSGLFKMGSKGREGDEDEIPEHEVTFREPFYMAATEVTFAQYDAFHKVTGDRYRRPDDVWDREEMPVIDVGWSRARAYANWLSIMTGKSCRLPSEAEWEYACRTGTTTRYAFRDVITENDANFSGNVGMTTEAGSYPANDWRLHDMHGNVWEWVEDCWHGSYNGAPEDGRAWLEEGGGDCGLRVLRGGSWDGFRGDARCADRDWHDSDDRGRGDPYYRGSDIGFRVLCLSPIFDR